MVEVGGGKDVVEVRVEVGDVVVDIVCDALQVCDEAGVGFAEGVLSFVKASEGVADVADGVVGVASGLKEGCWHAGAGERVPVWFEDRARKSKEGAESPAGLFAVVVDGVEHGRGRWRETAQLRSVVGDGDFQSLWVRLYVLRSSSAFSRFRSGSQEFSDVRYPFHLIR